MSESSRNDLVLSPNEFAFVLDTTKGNISSVVGPYKMSLSTSDKLVIWDERQKKFEEASGIYDAIQTFVTIPENWYCVLKNPERDGKHPQEATSNLLSKLDIGRKINIRGNTSFALYPGQMAKVICGHRLHSNQYLKARVYDANAANKHVFGIDEESKNLSLNEENNNKEEVNESEEKKKPELYVTGQILIIKGTDAPFYIPPTGIEVLPIGGRGNEYIRDALTLQKLEYCILVDESGNRDYVYGPAVVFPRPDQKFLKNEDVGEIIFRAIELSETSGVYVKVIEDYTDNDGTMHEAGEELFIKGDVTPIYFPRKEHSIVDYDGRVVHHATVIPSGEGYYVMNRQTGAITTVKGPLMYLPNPIYEVFAKRFLTEDQCKLWYPENDEVLNYNKYHGEYQDDDYDMDRPVTSLHKSVVAPRGFSRGTTYTKPRSVVINNKYDGCVTICVRTGYAINVISKSGEREVVVGPKTVLLDYDQTLEILEVSTGKPKTTDYMERFVYLRVDNNKISDIVSVQTSDFVNISLKLSYCVNFIEEYKDKWFAIENYVKYLCDRVRTILKGAIKDFTIDEFYENANEIIRCAVLDVQVEDIEVDEDGEETVPTEIVGRFFEENGMCISDVEILEIMIDESVRSIIDKHQENIILKTMELNMRNKEVAINEELAKLSMTEAQIESERDLTKYELDMKLNEKRAERDAKMIQSAKDNDELRKTHEALLTEIYNEKANRELNDKKNRLELLLRKEKEESARIAEVMRAISPNLISAMTSYQNAELVETVTKHLSPYALASDKSVVDVATQLLRGTSLEDSISEIVDIVNNIRNSNLQIHEDELD